MPNAAAPSSPPDGEPLVDRATPGVELRLAIGKDGLGLELARPARIACLDVTEIAVVISGVRFPLDVSGGVSRFRNRRGELHRLSLEAPARGIEAWAAPKLRGLVSTETPAVWIAVRRDAATVSIAAPSREEDASAGALAFELTIDTHEEDVRFTVTRARGLGLKAPAMALAMGAMRAVLGESATREGSRFTVGRAVTRLARTLLPEAGARAPSVTGVRWSTTSAATDAWLLYATREPQAGATDDAARAREEASIARDADDALVAGDFDRARKLAMAALERAPRHAGISARVAEIDLHVGGRAEAALSILDDAEPEASPRRGPLRAALLAESGDLRASVAAFARVGDTEPTPALAARAYERARGARRGPSRRAHVARSRGGAGAGARAASVGARGAAARGRANRGRRGRRRARRGARGRCAREARRVAPRRRAMARRGARE